MGVWVGYDMPRAMPGTYGADYAGSIWQAVMKTLHDGLEPLDWERPATVVNHTENGITDLYSAEVDVKRAQAFARQQENARQEAVATAVEKYEKTTISSVEDTYVIESDFDEINAVIAQVEDSGVRKELYDRAAAKRNALAAIRDSMADEIAYYESRKAEEESQAAIEREKQAEEDRKAQIRKTRLADFEDALAEIQALEYIPDDIDTMTDTLMEKLGNLAEYDEYADCAREAEAAILAAGHLPTKAEYDTKQQKLQAAKESESAAQQQQAEEAARRAEEAAGTLGHKDNPAGYGPGGDTDADGGPGYSRNNGGAASSSGPGAGWTENGGPGVKTEGGRHRG